MKKNKPVEDDDTDRAALSLFDIDQNMLDEEWRNHPAIYYEYAMQLADAKLDHEEHKVAFSLAEAELSDAIRANPEAYGLKKATDRSVENTIIQQERYLKLQRRVMKARHRVEVLSAICDSLDHKKRALENLTNLFGMNYFSGHQSTKKKKRKISEED